MSTGAILHGRKIGSAKALTHRSPCAGLIDPARAKGKWVLSEAEAALQGASQHVAAADVFRLWAEHARTMIQACQRRGESDGTVEWMYQHAALSPETADVPGW